MPSTLDTLLVILFAILPGIPGNTVYNKMAGTNWREEQWRTVVRILGISLGGLILYIIIGSFINAPLPSYISPTTFANFVVERTALVQMSVAFLGHFAGAIIVGYIGARVTQKLDEWTRSSEFIDSWHEFALVHASKHWVVVRIKGGEAYAGYIKTADTKVKAEDRNIILAEPAVYVKEQNKYLSQPYNYLFLPGKIIDSVAIYSKPLDKRITPIHEFLFSNSSQEGEKNAR